MNITAKNIYILLRIIIGAFFIGSAVTKLISIDSFEVFIYSLGLLNLDLSFLAARLVLSFELFTGILLITGIGLRVVIPATIALLTLFTAFIIWLMMFRSNSHCFCFGDIVKISNLWSVVKNIVLIMLLLVIARQPRATKQYRMTRHHAISVRYSMLIIIAALVVSLALPVISSPPDTFYYKHYSKNVTYDQLMLQEFLDEHSELKDGKRIVCFFGTGCRFCSLAVQKITVIADKADKADAVSCVFWGKEESVQGFYEVTNSHDFPYHMLSPDIFLRITNGEMPLILLLQDGVTQEKFGYRSINEKQIIEFLSN